MVFAEGARFGSQLHGNIEDSFFQKDDLSEPEQSGFSQFDAVSSKDFADRETNEKAGVTANRSLAFQPLDFIRLPPKLTSFDFSGRISTDFTTDLCD